MDILRVFYIFIISRYIKTLSYNSLNNVFRYSNNICHFPYFTGMFVLLAAVLLFEVKNTGMYFFIKDKICCIVVSKVFILSRCMKLDLSTRKYITLIKV